MAAVRDSIRAAKTHLAEARAQLRRAHEAGAPGRLLCAQWSDRLDAVLLEWWDATLADLGEAGPGGLAQHAALVPHGGYGRRDVAPFSDLDLMLLYAPAVEARVGALAQRLMLDVYDAGLVLGHSVRTPAQACRLAQGDSTIFTSLVESRFLAGSVRLYARFAAAFRRDAARRSRAAIAAMLKARREERAQFGETVYLLEPNVKRSHGGLRDIQLLRWVGFARFGEAEPEALLRLGAISSDDCRQIADAYEFLLRLRNDLHFHAGKAQDVLDRNEQLRIAGSRGYAGAGGVLPVEQFMREYFLHTSEVRNVVGHFVTSVQPTTFRQAALSLLSHQVEGDFRVGPTHIAATRRGLAKLRSDLAQVLRLMDLANLYNKRIDHATWQAIREAMSGPAPQEPSAEAIGRFLSLLAQPARLSDLLRRLHELRVLEKLVPGMDHARCLVQFNEYHKYTVDEHCLRAVECAAAWLTDEGPLGQVYRGIRQKRTLHLALLLHDLGKGRPEDHSEVGRRLAREAAERLRLPPREGDVLCFLVHRHLMMTHLALWRDTRDESVVVQFAVEVGSPEVLQMLYVLSCADLAAVGPGVLNQWKLDLLTGLYRRAMRHLAGELPPGGLEEPAERCRREAREWAARRPAAAWLLDQLAVMPAAYLEEMPPRRLIEVLEHIRELPRNDALAWGRFLEDRGVVEFTVGAYERAKPGIFHRLTGVLTSKGFQILSAEIHTLADGVVLDRFYVQDCDHAGPPPEQRLRDTARALADALRGAAPVEPSFRKLWGARRRAPADAAAPPVRVEIDNSTSDRFTIIDIFAHDRMGLLYAIARALYELELSIAVAKIGTHLDQVVDVFYVTDPAGRKIEDPLRLQQIRDRLLAAVATAGDDATGNRTP